MTYKEWLFQQIETDEYNRDNYSGLLNILLDVIYEYDIWKDENRAFDGILLREKWQDFFECDGYKENVFTKPCTVLEMLIAICDRISYATDECVEDNSIAYWFWILMKNSGLIQFNNAKFERCKDKKVINVDLDIRTILQNIMHHNIEPDGFGGFFPLNYPKCNQQKVEIWDQMNSWILENVNI